MAKYRITAPDGQVYSITAPDDATEEQVLAYAQQQFAQPKPAAQPAQQPAGADDPGALMAGLIGAGRTVDQIIDGMKQLGFNLTGNREALDNLASDQAEKSRLYQPLKDQRPIMTAIGEAAPGMVIPIGGGATMAANAVRLAASGAVPSALEYGSAGERAGRAAAGAAGAVTGGIVLPAAGRAIAKTVPAIGRTVKAVVEPLTDGGRTAIAGRTLRNAAGESADDVARRMASAAPLVPGSIPTAAQVAESGGIAALERAVAQANPSDFAQRGMEQAAARTGALRQIAGDDTARAAAVAARKAATDPLYSQATQALYTVDPKLERLLQTPAMKKALERAKTLAEDSQRPFSFDVTPAAPFSGVGGNQGQAVRQITGQGLQDLKMAIDSMLTDPASGYAGAAGDAVKNLRGQLLNWMEGSNSAFKAARTKYAELSKPVSQIDIGKELLTRLEPALNDYGGLARETGSKYAAALRNADQTARVATKFKGAGMADVMEPAQMETLTAIARDLGRKANAQDLGRGVGSDTFQKLAMSNIAERSGAPGVVGGAMNLPGVSKFAKFLYAEPEEKIQSIIAQSLLDPTMGARLMTQPRAMPVKPISAAQTLLANPARATQLLGGGGGLATANLFAE